MILAPNLLKCLSVGLLTVSRDQTRNGIYSYIKSNSVDFDQQVVIPELRSVNLLRNGLSRLLDHNCFTLGHCKF